MSTAVDVVVETDISESTRARQLEAMFDVPYSPHQRMEWHGQLPLDDRDWNIGLIVGPSGSGKTSVARSLYGEPRQLEWAGQSVIDDFADGLGIEEISGACSAVGFNTIPAWLRPYRHLSTGEQFRVELARRMIEAPADETVCVDEFTSVVDRQVAQIGSHAVAKWTRKLGRRFVAASCHYDIIDWLQPDWVLEPATMSFEWRHLQRRPSLECQVSRVPYAAWQLFAPYHYLTQSLHRSARCHVCFVEGRPVAFLSTLYRPHPQTRNLYGVPRGVTLPDWQGLGFIMMMCDLLGGAYKAQGARLRTYPAHPSLIRSVDRSPNWAMIERPKVASRTKTTALPWWGAMGTRPNAVFEYCGPPSDDHIAELLGPK